MLSECTHLSTAGKFHDTNVGIVPSLSGVPNPKFAVQF
jgi:hypothetical protein